MNRSELVKLWRLGMISDDEFIGSVTLQPEDNVPSKFISMPFLKSFDFEWSTDDLKLVNSRADHSEERVTTKITRQFSEYAFPMYDAIVYVHEHERLSFGVHALHTIGPVGETGTPGVPGIPDTPGTASYPSPHE